MGGYCNGSTTELPLLEATDLDPEMLVHGIIGQANVTVKETVLQIDLSPN